MTQRLITIEFERLLLFIDSNLATSNKLSTDNILSIVNNAIEKFTTTRYTGTNYRLEAFELTLKRSDDLRRLVVNADLSDKLLQKTSSEITVELPLDYMFLLGDTAFIYPTTTEGEKCWEKDKDGFYVLHRTDTLEGTIETLDRMLGNSLSEYRLRYCKARPIRLIGGNNILLYTDGNYTVKSYQISYLKKPKKLSLKALTEEYEDLPDHTIREIVEIAVGLFMSTLNDQRYNSINSEIATME